MSMTLPDPLLWDDLEHDPTNRDWVYTPAKDQEPTGAWQDGYLGLHDGIWDTPHFPVEPFWWIRWRAEVYAPEGSHAGVIFFDDNGKMLDADHYSGIDAADDWQTVEVCVRAKARAASAMLRFNGMNGKPLTIRAVEVRPITLRAVLDWSKEVAAQCPPVAYTPPRGRWQYLTFTRQFLAYEPWLRVVMLGDSNINDIGSAPFDARLSTVWPKCRMEVITAVGGGKGCRFYAEDRRVQSYVLDHEPQLVMIGGVSNGELGPIRDVIQQIRRGGNIEIMLMSGCFSKMTAENMAQVLTWSEQLGELAASTSCAYLDLRTAWLDYIGNDETKGDFLRRDKTHANERGRQWAAQVLERWFSP